MPERIQLKRTKGWKMPENTVKVDRTTKWGNPFRAVGGWTVEEVVRMFRMWLEGSLPSAGPHPSKDEIRRELRGKNLACWCKPGDVCHADVLLRIANSESAK